MDFGETIVVALTSGVVVAYLSDYLHGRRREADVREARRNEAARIVGPALASLRDMEPESNVAALRGNAAAGEALKQKWEAWLTAAGELEVLGATHPDTDVDDRCQSVIAKGSQLLNRIHIAIHNGGAMAQQEWDRLKTLHADAVADARQLVQDVLHQPA